VKKQLNLKKKEIKQSISQLQTICSDFNYFKEIDLTIRLLEERIEYQRKKNNRDAIVAAQMILKSFKDLRRALCEWLS